MKNQEINAKHPVVKILIGIILLACFALTGFSQTKASAAEQEVRKLERAWLDAYEQNDAKAMESIVADDFIITFSMGARQTKPQLMEAIRMPRNSANAVKFYTEDVQARVYDNSVILIGRVVAEYHRDGKTVKERSNYTDTYVRQNGRWQVAASHLSKIVEP